MPPSRTILNTEPEENSLESRTDFFTAITTWRSNAAGCHTFPPVPVMRLITTIVAGNITPFPFASDFYLVLVQSNVINSQPSSQWYLTSNRTQARELVGLCHQPRIALGFSSPLARQESYNNFIACGVPFEVPAERQRYQDYFEVSLGLNNDSPEREGLRLSTRLPVETAADLITRIRAHLSLNTTELARL